MQSLGLELSSEDILTFIRHYHEIGKPALLNYRKLVKTAFQPATDTSIILRSVVVEEEREKVYGKRKHGVRILKKPLDTTRTIIPPTPTPPPSRLVNRSPNQHRTLTTHDTLTCAREVEFLAREIIRSKWQDGNIAQLRLTSKFRSMDHFRNGSVDKDSLKKIMGRFNLLLNDHTLDQLLERYPYRGGGNDEKFAYASFVEQIAGDKWDGGKFRYSLRSPRSLRSQTPRRPPSTF